MWRKFAIFCCFLIFKIQSKALPQNSAFASSFALVQEKYPGPLIRTDHADSIHNNQDASRSTSVNNENENRQEYDEKNNQGKYGNFGNPSYSNNYKDQNLYNAYNNPTPPPPIVNNNGPSNYNQQRPQISSSNYGNYAQNTHKPPTYSTINNGQSSNYQQNNPKPLVSNNNNYNIQRPNNNYQNPQPAPITQKPIYSPNYSQNTPKPFNSNSNNYNNNNQNSYYAANTQRPLNSYNNNEQIVNLQSIPKPPSPPSRPADNFYVYQNNQNNPPRREEPMLHHERDPNPIMLPNEQQNLEIVFPPTINYDEIKTTTRASFLDDLFNLRKTTKVPSNTNVSEYSINSNNENQQHQKFKEDRRRE